MLTKDAALTIALNYVSGIPYDRSGDNLVLVDNATIEKPYGWIFFYTSKRWRETGDAAYVLSGNAPFLVEKQSGSVVIFPPAYPLEEAIRAYERSVRDGKPFDPLHPFG